VSDPTYTDGCPFVLGGPCAPTGRIEDCNQDLAYGCDADNTNCYYDFPYCQPVDAGHVKYGVRMVYNGVRGVVVFDIETEQCELRPCL
jgi:hypothetical protein